MYYTPPYRTREAYQGVYALLPYPGGMLGVYSTSYRTRETCLVCYTRFSVGRGTAVCAEASPSLNTHGNSRLITHIVDLFAQRWPIARAS